MITILTCLIIYGVAYFIVESIKAKQNENKETKEQNINQVDLIKQICDLQMENKELLDRLERLEHRRD